MTDLHLSSFISTHKRRHICWLARIIGTTLCESCLGWISYSSLGNHPKKFLKLIFTCPTFLRYLCYVASLDMSEHDNHLWHRLNQTNDKAKETDLNIRTHLFPWMEQDGLCAFIVSLSTCLISLPHLAYWRRRRIEIRKVLFLKGLSHWNHWFAIYYIHISADVPTKPMFKFVL